MTTKRNPRPRLAPPKSLVLVGMMGSGKTAIGRRLAAQLELPFIDADEEIEAAAGCSIVEFFAMHGESAFRDGERRVIQRLLLQPVSVLATGGGAFMDKEIRRAIRRNGISIWLKADVETLWQRVTRREHRPLLKTENPRAALEKLVETRYPMYANADLTVASKDGPLDETVDRVIEAVRRHLEMADE